MSLEPVVPRRSVCPKCGQPVKEEDRFTVAAKGNLNMSHVAIRIVKGVIETNYHKGCVEEDESEWIRNARGVVVSKGAYRIFKTDEGGMVKVRR